MKANAILNDRQNALSGQSRYRPWRNAPQRQRPEPVVINVIRSGRWNGPKNASGLFRMKCGSGVTPGSTYFPGVRLSWLGVATGKRLFADHQGNWGFIRLFDSAQVTQLDSGRCQPIWQTAEVGALQYVLLSELREGPLALLRLRNFRLPEHIFL